MQELFDALAGTSGELNSVPSERMVVAKYNRRQKLWAVIARGGTSHSISKSGKKTGTRKGGRNDWILRNGDMIAFKDSEEDPLDNDDFATPGDIAFQKDKQLEDERKRSQRAGSNFGDSIKNKGKQKERPVEVGLKITVPTFSASESQR